jgi:hypothetical protein
MAEKSASREERKENGCGDHGMKSDSEFSGAEICGVRVGFQAMQHKNPKKTGHTVTMFYIHCISWLQRVWIKEQKEETLTGRPVGGAGDPPPAKLTFTFIIHPSPPPPPPSSSSASHLISPVIHPVPSSSQTFGRSYLRAQNLNLSHQFKTFRTIHLVLKSKSLSNTIIIMKVLTLTTTTFRSSSSPTENFILSVPTS